jgi:hypothetical protein
VANVLKALWQHVVIDANMSLGATVARETWHDDNGDDSIDDWMVLCLAVVVVDYRSLMELRRRYSDHSQRLHVHVNEK